MKSRMKIDFLPLVVSLFMDATKKCCADQREARRDLQTIKRRLKNEGLSFLTITLPDFGKAFDKSLSIGQVCQQDFQSWKFSAGLPVFLKGFLCTIFDSQGGLRDEPSKQSIEVVRQLCLAFKKLDVPCTYTRTIGAVEKYVATERTLRSAVLPSDCIERYALCSRLLWGNLFADFSAYETIPKHGPGAVLEHHSPNGKWRLENWQQRVEADFPYDRFACLNASEIADIGLNYEVVPDGYEPAMKMALVPKTSKTPRIIAISSCCMQYLQQGIKDYMVKVLENSDITKGHINFTDQSVNQRLAMKSSRDGRLATLDLSEASDRVLMSLVRTTFSSCPDLLRALESTREDEVKLPFLIKINKDVAIRKLRLKKFAGMGSAVCFPVEAIVFFTIIVAALLECRRLRTTLRNIKLVSRDVYVYGDDLIVPADEAHFVISWLERFHCRINSGKSFTTGNFRESCGVDAYDGHLVTPTYIRTPWPDGERNARKIQSLVATGNQLYDRGFVRSATYIRERIEELTGPLPGNMGEEFAGLSWSWIEGLKSLRVRFNRKLQCTEINVPVSSPSRFDDPIDDYRALLKTLSGMERCSIDNGGLGNPFHVICRTSTQITIVPRIVSQRVAPPLFQPRQGYPICLIENKAEATSLEWVLVEITPQRSERHGASTLKRRWVGSTVLDPRA